MDTWHDAALTPTVSVCWHEAVAAVLTFEYQSLVYKKWPGVKIEGYLGAAPHKSHRSQDR